MDSSGLNSGFLGSLRSLGDSLLGSLQSRLSLLSIELQEEKFRLLQFVIWITVLLFTGVMAVAFASLALAFWLWQSSPLLALSLLAGVYLLAFLILVISFRSYLKRQTPPFDATLQELSKDRATLRGE